MKQSKSKIKNVSKIKPEKQRILKELHEMATGLHKAGVMDTITMREFDVICLPAIVNLTAKQIKEIRKREHVSQTVFASFLNTTTSTVKQWEQGKKHPRGTSLKLLNLVAQKGLDALL